MSEIESAISGVRKSLDRLEKSEKRQIAEPEANAPAVTEIQPAMVLPAAETPPPFEHEQDSGLRETAAITAAATTVLRQAVRLRETAAITAITEETPLPAEAEKTEIPPPPQTKPREFTKPKQEPEPSWLGLQLQKARTWLFSEGNVWVTIGVLLCIAGFGLLFSYAAQMKWISLEMRLVVSALAGAAMTAFGWRMRARRRTYALILQGGGIGIMYVVLVAGAKLGPIAPSAAIFGMIALSVFTIFPAVRQDFEPLALFALLGGYAAPIIVSTGSSNFVALFSIYSLLNLEILIINVRRDWRKTRWGGMAASGIVGAMWGFLRWRTMLFAAVEPFLVLYFINYAIVAMIPLARGKLAKFVKPEGRRADVPMMASLPFIFLALQMEAAAHTAWGVSITCAALGASYLALAYLTRRDSGQPERTVSGICLAYGAIFLNLAVPFAFRKAATSCVWAAEGAALVAFSRRLGRRAFTSGVVLQICSLLIYLFAPFVSISSRLYDPSFRMDGFLDWRNAGSDFLLTSLIFAASALVSSYFTEREYRGEKNGMRSAWGFAAYGTLWWTMAAAHAASFVIQTPDITVILFLCAGACAAYLASAFIRWDSAASVAFPPIATMTVLGIFRIFPYTGMFRHHSDLLSMLYDAALKNNALNWIAAAAMFGAALYFYRGRKSTELRRAWWGFVLFAFASYTSRLWNLWIFNFINGPGGGKPSDSHFLASFLPIMAASLLFAHPRGARRIGMEDYSRAGAIACWALMASVLRIFLGSLWMKGSGIAGHYIPFINPLELWQIMFLAAVWILLAVAHDSAARRSGMRFALPAAVFLWLNCVAGRAAFHCFGESVTWATLGSAPHFQAIIAMLWGAAALALIYCGKRLTERYLWFLGAGLLALDIAKLLLLDLRNSATIIRIVAFLATGGFFLFVGWTAPLPPKKMNQHNT
ncbi:MAG: DUF2339 domain-containing protein [Synergistaceae bacterium]|nr:DUF2339 domain-containing protein [Synergistaceae bacterium]